MLLGTYLPTQYPPLGPAVPHTVSLLQLTTRRLWESCLFLHRTKFLVYLVKVSVDIIGDFLGHIFSGFSNENMSATSSAITQSVNVV